MSIKEIRLTPQDVLLKAFEYFNTDSLDRDSLIRIALASNCPNSSIAQSVIERMVSEGQLTKQNRDGKEFFSPTQSVKKGLAN